MEQKYQFLLITIGMTFGLILLLLFIRRVHNSDYDKMELNQPFIAASESREEAAWREAQEGFEKCEACGFTNFKRIVTCSVCHAPLGDEKTKAKYAKKNKNNANKDGSVRAQRAIKRKEWSRKLDVEGKLYWFRDAINTSLDKLLPGFTFSFVANEAPATANVTKTLHMETEGMQVEYLDVAKASPLAFAVGEPLVLLDSVSELLELNSQDFPYKYAEYIRRATLVLEPLKRQLLRMKISKVYGFEQSMEHLSCVPPKNTRLPINVIFQNASYLSEVHDKHDNHREWFVIVNDTFAKPATGLFTCVNEVDQSYYINPNSKAVFGEDHLNCFYATGRVIGRALLHGDLMAFHLATPLLKILLGLPLSFHDLEHFDPVTYKNLKYLLENDNVESLDLDFSIQEKRGDEIVTIDLIPNGRNVGVTDANKKEYLMRRAQHVHVESVSSQLYALCKGFYEVVPQELLLIFDPEEIDYVLCGSDEIDVGEWERTTRFNQYLYQHPVKKWFWQLVREMPLDYKKRLLHFTTGSTRVPIGGFSALSSSDGRLAPFTLQSIELVDSRSLRSFSCFNRLELPLYIKKSELKANLLSLLAPENYEHACD
ncbi:hypothetical protein Poli38472_014334 [Pythium oligandrum]|uniref:HECT-type E3 ubiquitin transferase n=1 Tax=Pythium oligandrum TaxID=41045 RepID=A0A8K1C798_PYTOL|nr:hypothetical protein Poli38472_014334 [Pythium oligandrum]|eukprot:TMW57731.1 hypothetical protein Poli38472_014334 [Pythium oligandrum]